MDGRYWYRYRYRYRRNRHTSWLCLSFLKYQGQPKNRSLWPIMKPNLNPPGRKGKWAQAFVKVWLMRWLMSCHAFVVGACHQRQVPPCSLTFFDSMRAAFVCVEARKRTRERCRAPTRLGSTHSVCLLCHLCRHWMCNRVCPALMQFNRGGNRTAAL